MRIELPLPSWAEAQRVHDDAHTLTVPPQLPQAVPSLLAPERPRQEDCARIEVRDGRHPALTLTF